VACKASALNELQNRNPAVHKAVLSRAQRTERLNILPSTAASLCSGVPHVPALLLAVAQEGPVLTGVDVGVYGDEEALVELEGTWELLRQLPNTLQELVDDWRHLFGISIQVSVPAEAELCSQPTQQPTLRNSMTGRRRSWRRSGASLMASYSAPLCSG